MWRIAGIVVVSLLMIMIEMPSLKKGKKKKELWVFATLLLAGTTLNIVISTGIEVPTPLIWIKFIYEPIGQFIQGIMKARS